VLYIARIEAGPASSKKPFKRLLHPSEAQETPLRPETSPRQPAGARSLRRHARNKAVVAHGMATRYNASYDALS